MDAVSANRIDANIAARPGGSVGLPAVSGNAGSNDPLQPRRAAQPDAVAATGAGDDKSVRGAKPLGLNRSFSAEEQSQLRELRARDREVRAHEQAHLSAAGAHARGGASFTYETGPDGRRYAVGGEVSIDTAEVAGDPQATLAKARQVRRAALAPADPSPQDRQVAARAAAMAREASAEIAQQRIEAQSGTATSGRLDRAYQAADDATSLVNLVA
ncbi:MAG: hypothetical protein KJO54_03245 [Gammaproteobacteria bacterium]|nr:hypothetical protein [Gammaproteobacteria bacterium]NNF60531.1 hypothetical protein [Gammaproteobacteria bacterium]NNM20287.1 hypothetical protein [Gammaproteobacteria bacterium]